MRGDGRDRSGTAWVAEDFDRADGSRLAARFSVHWQSDDDQVWLQGPEGVSAEEAIIWGRRHAEVVMVLLGGEELHFSAGDRQPDGEELPEWPAGGIEVRPRPVGSPQDGSRQTVEWLVRSEVRTSASPGDLAIGSAGASRPLRTSRGSCL